MTSTDMWIWNTQARVSRAAGPGLRGVSEALRAERVVDLARPDR